MKLLKIKSQMRRDFTGEYQCEGCGHTCDIGGYDDDYFHQKVMPARKCKECGKSTLDLGEQVEPVQTKYPDHLTV